MIVSFKKSEIEAIQSAINSFEDALSHSDDHCVEYIKDIETLKSVNQKLFKAMLKYEEINL